MEEKGHGHNYQATAASPRGPESNRETGDNSPNRAADQNSGMNIYERMAVEMRSKAVREDIKFTLKQAQT